jgi:Zn-dependent protease with chaperone function
MGKRNLLSSVVIILLVAAPFRAAHADGGPTPTPSPLLQGRDEQFEQKIEDQLAKINPQAAQLFKKATSEMDSGDNASAEADFLAALKLAPNSADILRRLSYVEAELKASSKAVEYARAAVAIENSAINEAALAQALLTLDTPKDNLEALSLAQSAISKDNTDPYVAQTLFAAGLANNSKDDVLNSSKIIMAAQPNSPYSHIDAGIAAAVDGRWLEADNELTIAEKLGMPASVVEDMRQRSGIEARARFYRTLYGGVYTFIGWLLGFVVLFAGGVVLSNLTLATARRMKPDEVAQVKPAERTIRTIYRGVIIIASAYFYISIPIILLITVAMAGTIVYLFLQSGIIPIQLTAALGLGTLFTLYTVLRSLFVHISQVDPGPRLNREDAPRLWQVMKEVAERVATRPVDSIFITPTPEIAVTERGGMLARLAGRGERILILGLGTLQGMTQAEFKAIIAHEYGHFSNRDTAGGRLALRVQATIFMMAQGLVAQRQNTWFNPVWLFLYRYSRLFARITLGASRLQEILADRAAAMAYGASNLADALTHVMRATYEFSTQATNEIRQAYQLKRAVMNLYALPAITSESDSSTVKTRIEQEMTRPTSAYDSHPAMKDRLEMIKHLESVASGEKKNKDVWELLPDAESLQQQMSQMLYDRATSRRA